MPVEMVLPKDNQNEFRIPRKYKNICIDIDVFTYECWHKHIYLHVCVCAWAYTLLNSGEKVMKQNIWVAGTIFLAPPTKKMAKDSWDTTEWMLWQVSISFHTKNKKKITNMVGEYHKYIKNRINEIWWSNMYNFTTNNHGNKQLQVTKKT